MGDYDYMAYEPPPPTHYSQIAPEVWHTMADYQFERLYDDIKAGEAEIPYDRIPWEALITVHNRLGDVARQRRLKAATVALIKATSIDTYIDMFSFSLVNANGKREMTILTRALRAAAAAWRMW